MAGAGVTMISGRLDVGLPLLVAAELAYLALVGGNAQFQRYVDIAEHQQSRGDRSRQNQQLLRRILGSLPRPLRDRYHQLQQRCRELQGIAADLKQPGDGELDQSLHSYQAQGLDRLLWIYLRLLFTYHALHKFLEKTSLERIQSDMQRIERRLNVLDPQDTSAHTLKLRKTLEDNLRTSQDRARNYERARANHEFVELEIDRLENKIKSLAEVAVNRQEPEFVSAQVDQVASSMLETERTMNELQVFTGLTPTDDEAPPLLDMVPQRERQ